MSNTMSNLQSSILKFSNDFCVAHPGLKFVNFDAHANEEEAPPGDFMGPSGFMFDIDENLIVIEVAFGISTESDTNLFRLSSLMGQLVELVKPGQRLSVVDAETGADIGWMAVGGKVRVTPVGGTKAKPVQMVMLTLHTSLMYKTD